MGESNPKRWLGYLRGSRKGTLFLVQHDENHATLTIGFTDAGDMKLRVVAAGESGNFELYPLDSNQRFGSGRIERETGDEVAGSWEFASGAEGIFDLKLHLSEGATAQSLSAADQLWNREVPLGAITLYRNDLARLIAEMEALVPAPNVTTIRATEHDQIVVEPAVKFLARKDFVDVVRVMTISTSEISVAPLKKIVSVILDDSGSSQIQVSSPDELWTSAASSRLEKFLHQFSSRFTGWLRKNGLNINSFILIAILIWMPDRPLAERILVFSAGVILIAIIVRSHRLVPYNRVYLDPEKHKRPFAKEIPGATMAALAAGVTGILSSVPQILAWIDKVVERLFKVVGL